MSEEAEGRHTNEADMVEEETVVGISEVKEISIEAAGFAIAVDFDLAENRND